MDPLQDNQEVLSKVALLHRVLFDTNCQQKVIDAILIKGVDVNYPISTESFLSSIQPNLIGGTALHIAAFKNNIIFFNTLLSNGADFTIQNQDGNTILHYVDKNIPRHANFTYSILSAHIKLNIAKNPRNNKGISHFLIACLTDNIQAAKYFLNNNVSVDEATNFDFNDLPGYNGLHMAAKYSCRDLFNLLLNHDANIYLKNAAGMTALDILLEQKLSKLAHNDGSLKNNFIEIIENMVKLLLDNSDIDQLFSNNNTGLTCFQVACTMQDSSLAERLVEQVDNLNYQIRMNSPIFAGYSGLHFAAHCNLNIVEMLLNRHADPSVKDAKGVTPLDILLQNLTAEKMLSLIQFNESWKMTSFTDGRIRLFNFIRAMTHPEIFAAYLKK